MADRPDLPFDLDLELAGRYVTGVATPEERRTLERWMAVDPSRRTVMVQFEAAWRRAGTSESRASDVADKMVDVDVKWLALRQAMGPTRVVAFPSPARMRRSALMPAVAAVAVAVAALGIGLLWKANIRPSDLKPPAGAMREYVTPRGQRAGFRLPDGTQVMLSVNSRLQVPLDYGIRDRDLFLDGEAYFEVQHNPKARFLVHTAYATTEDLGTRFTVRAYPGDTLARVVVIEGQVALRGRRKHALLAAGDLGRATAGGDIAIQHGNNPEDYLAWMKGRLEFQGTRLQDAIPEMNRWFDLDLQLGDTSLALRRLSASFGNQPDDQVLEGMAQTLGLRIERQGRVIILYDARGAHP